MSSILKVAKRRIFDTKQLAQSIDAAKSVDEIKLASIRQFVGSDDLSEINIKKTGLGRKALTQLEAETLAIPGLTPYQRVGHLMKTMREKYGFINKREFPLMMGRKLNEYILRDNIDKIHSVEDMFKLLKEHAAASTATSIMPHISITKYNCAVPAYIDAGSFAFDRREGVQHIYKRDLASFRAKHQGERCNFNSYDLVDQFYRWNTVAWGNLGVIRNLAVINQVFALDSKCAEYRRQLKSVTRRIMIMPIPDLETEVFAVHQRLKQLIPDLAPTRAEQRQPIRPSM